MDELAAPPADGYEGSERLVALKDGLAHLPERQRRGILLREWQGLSYAEIAEELGLSLGAVETLLFRARRNLASRLQHVRSGAAAINAVTLAPFVRSLARGGLGKLGLVGAGATVALVPVVAIEIAPALAHDKPTVTLRSAAPAAPARSPQLAAAPSRRSTSPVSAPGVLPAAVRQRQAGRRPATATEAAGATSTPTSARAPANSEKPPAAAPGSPSVAPTPLTPPAPVPTPSLQPPAVLPPAVTEPLVALTNVVSGATNALPVGK